MARHIEISVITIVKGSGEESPRTYYRVPIVGSHTVFVEVVAAVWHQFEFLWVPNYDLSD